MNTTFQDQSDEEGTETRKGSQGSGEASEACQGKQEAEEEEVKKYIDTKSMLLRLEMYITSSGSLRAFAREFHLSESQISKIRQGKMEPTDDLLEVLSLKRTILYEEDLTYGL